MRWMVLRFVVNPLELCMGGSPGLVFHRGDFIAPAFRLGFNDAHRLAIHKST